jgi:hypothetical protein
MKLGCSTKLTHLPIPVLKDVLLNHAVFTEAEYNKGNSYLRLGVRLNYFGKFDKLIIEPRINIRQQVSKQFALKLEGI